MNVLPLYMNLRLLEPVKVDSWQSEALQRIKSIRDIRNLFINVAIYLLWLTLAPSNLNLFGKNYVRNIISTQISTTNYPLTSNKRSRKLFVPWFYTVHELDLHGSPLKSRSNYEQFNATFKFKIIFKNCGFGFVLTPIFLVSGILGLSLLAFSS